mgnify:CR=1 FL=1
MEAIMMPVAVLGITGVLMGLFLAYASKKFEVEVDPKVEAILAILPGVNCGACGYPGCSGYASGVALEGAKMTLCAPGGPKVAAKIGDIMGVAVEMPVKKKPAAKKPEVKKEAPKAQTGEPISASQEFIEKNKRMLMKFKEAFDTGDKEGFEKLENLAKMAKKDELLKYYEEIKAGKTVPDPATMADTPVVKEEAPKVESKKEDTQKQEASYCSVLGDGLCVPEQNEKVKEDLKKQAEPPKSAEQLEKEQEAIQYYSKAMENHQVPYSVVKEHYELVLDKLNSIDEDQTDLVNTLSDLRSQEKAIRDGLDVFELDLRNMKRTIEKYHLPGLPKEYLELFFATSNRIEQLWQKMNRVKLDMSEINAANNVIEEDVEKLDILTEQIVDNAQLTEYMIQHANRYRLSHPEIETAIGRALDLFNHTFKYDESLQIIESALEQVEPGAGNRVRQNYQSEKNNSLFF